jgi:aflatoxin B1 aldehyde reductase
MVVSQVNVLHAHRADMSTPLEEQVRNFNEQIELGRCKAVGFVHIHMVAGLLRYDPLTRMSVGSIKRSACNVGADASDLRREGFTEAEVLPGRLQSHYTRYGVKIAAYTPCSWNDVQRLSVRSSVVCLQQVDIVRLTRHSPLAAGFLTGKLTNNQAAGTRFDASNPLGPTMKKVFGAEELQVGVKKLDAAVREYGLTPAEVAIRWLAYHSALTENDGIILGASRVEQVIETVGFIRKGPLEEGVLAVAKELWEDVKSVREEVV